MDTEKGEKVEDVEYTKEMKLSITYDNLVLKSVNMSGKSNQGTSLYMKASVAIKNSLKVELPKNWKDLLNK